jgi:ATP-independent RNA helicase DbpA
LEQLTIMTPDTAFSSLPLAPSFLDNLAQLGYAQMTPVQAAALPPALEGRDLIAQAKTGSGKTAAFGIGMLQKLNPTLFAVQGMVLCPTRELADQVACRANCAAWRAASATSRSWC